MRVLCELKIPLLRLDIRGNSGLCEWDEGMARAMSWLLQSLPRLQGLQMDTTVPLRELEDAIAILGPLKERFRSVLRTLDVHTSSRSAAGICRLRRSYLQELDLRLTVFGEDGRLRRP